MKLKGSWLSSTAAPLLLWTGLKSLLLFLLDVMMKGDSGNTPSPPLFFLLLSTGGSNSKQDGVCCERMSCVLMIQRLKQTLTGPCYWEVERRASSTWSPFKTINRAALQLFTELQQIKSSPSWMIQTHVNLPASTVLPVVVEMFVPCLLLSLVSLETKRWFKSSWR